MKSDRERKAERQRRWATFHLVFAIVRAILWTALIVAYFAGASVAETWFRSLAFTAFASIYANILTELSLAMAAYAGVIGADSRQDVTRASDAIQRRILETVQAIEARQAGE